MMRLRGPNLLLSCFLPLLRAPVVRPRIDPRILFRNRLAIRRLDYHDTEELTKFSFVVYPDPLRSQESRKDLSALEGNDDICWGLSDLSSECLDCIVDRLCL
jgi:hypothetical protein